MANQPQAVASRGNQHANVSPRRSSAMLAAVRAVSLGVSITIALVVAELGMRLAGYSPAYVNAMGSFHEPDRVSGHRGKRNFQGRFKTPQFDVLVAHNDQGFRRQESQNPESAAGRRMFVFGDSFVWGWGVDQGEVFTDCLSRRLPDWHIENLGINGTGTVAQYELFVSERRDHLRSQDVVLLTFFGNDFADNVEGARRGEVVDGKVVILPADPREPPGWVTRLKESSYLFNYLSFVVNRCQLQWRVRRAHEKAVELAAAAEVQAARDAADSSTASGAAKPQAVEASGAAADNTMGALAATQDPPSSPPVSTGPLPPVALPALPGDAASQIAVTRHCLEMWQHDCRRRGARLLVAFIPGVTELDEGGNAAMHLNELAFRQAFFSCADSLSIETIDLLPGLLDAKRAAGIERLLIPADGHWNATAHRIVGGIIASRLTDATTANR